LWVRLQPDILTGVLSLRLVIFAAVSGIALWGLFSLLDNLREPGLLRSAKTIVVKGCGPIESAQARQLCPQLFCQKFLLQGRRLPLRSVFKVTVDTTAGNEHLIGGVVETGSPESDRHFVCILRDHQVITGQVVDGAHLEALAAQPSNWSLSP
jgi:hypothetical protein